MGKPHIAWIVVATFLVTAAAGGLAAASLSPPAQAGSAGYNTPSSHLVADNVAVTAATDDRVCLPRIPNVSRRDTQASPKAMD